MINAIDILRHVQQHIWQFSDGADYSLAIQIAYVAERAVWSGMEEAEAGY